MNVLRVVSYSIYQAANESTAMGHLKLTRKWFNKSQFDDKFDIYQCSDFKDIILDHPCCYDEKIAKQDFDNESIPICEQYRKALDMSQHSQIYIYIYR